MSAPNINDATIVAASFIAEQWAPALSRSWQWGRETGYREGWQAGYERHRDEVNLAWGVYRDAIKHPSREAIEAAQAEPVTFCARRCRKCSGCVRGRAIWSNRQKYGSDDYPGVQAVAA